MRVDLVTLFPELFTSFFELGMIGRAVSSGIANVRFKSPRDFGVGKHQSVDDTPYGGGAGMVMRVDCVVASLEALDADAGGGRAHRVLLTPQGKLFNQGTAERLSRLPALALVCGRYEGIDDRIRHFVDEEISVGDFVLSGGEVAAMAVLDACLRLLPSVLGNSDSPLAESHSPLLSGMLEYPQFTRPVEFRGLGVPEVLKQGNHAKIASYRREQAEARTREMRPDLWARIEQGRLLT